jgi:hypothetical protein
VSDPQEPQPLDPDPNVPMPDPERVDTPAEAVREMNQQNMAMEANTDPNLPEVDPDAETREQHTDEERYGDATLPPVDPNLKEALPEKAPTVDPDTQEPIEPGGDLPSSRDDGSDDNG